MAITFNPFLGNFDFKGSGSGTTGPTGPTGSQGSQGTAGSQGIQGTAGSSGVTGPTGPAGSQGTAGAQGSQGTAGANGSQGTAGINGVTGPTGPTGRIPTVVSVATASAPTPNSDTTDIYEITAQNVTGAFVAPSGTPVDGQKLIIQVTPSGTGQSMSWSTATGGYTGTTTVPLPLTTGATSKVLNIGFMYVTANSVNKWMCLAAVQQ